MQVSQVLMESGDLHIERICQGAAGTGAQPIEACFQCHKCSSGCPVAGEADYTPSQAVRLLQYGMEDLLLKGRIIWLCTGCETCGARCPNGINMGRVIDGLKEMARTNNGKGVPELLFHHQFLASVRTYGRVHEAGMMVRYKLKSGQLFTDLKLGLNLLKRGKLKLLPSRIKSNNQVRLIFDNSSLPG